VFSRNTASRLRSQFLQSASGNHFRLFAFGCALALSGGISHFSPTQRHGHLVHEGVATSSINIERDPNGTVLSYNYGNQRQGEEVRRLEYLLNIEWTHCNYGGPRPWFRCPAKGCGRRVAGCGSLWWGHLRLPTVPFSLGTQSDPAISSITYCDHDYLFELPQPRERDAQSLRR
jgi:hypothetical protein